jgi:hypothetical protein
MGTGRNEATMKEQEQPKPAKTRSTLYEWGLETIDPDDGDVMWTRHGKTLAKLLEQLPKRFADVLAELRTDTKRLVLIKDTWTEADGLVDRRYAHITFDRHAQTIVFDQIFTGGDKVPQRFKKQFDAVSSQLWEAWS